MRCNTFLRSALFAAVAALCWLPWALIVAPFAGVWNARALYLVVVAAAYVAGLAAPGMRRMTGAVTTAFAGLLLFVVARTTGELAFGLAALIGLARGVFLHRAAPGRAVASEICLLGGGLVFARFLAAATPAPTALAVWGFLLVQSLFLLFGDPTIRPAPRSAVDPFDEAHRRAVALLERDAV